MEMAEADDEVTDVREILNHNAIPECSLSDNKGEDDDVGPTSFPSSSDPANGDSSSSGSTSSESYPIHYPANIHEADIEVVGEYTSEKNTEDGIGCLNMVKEVKHVG